MLTTTKLLPEGYCLIKDIESLKSNDSIKKQYVYIYDPNEDVFNLKYAWGAVEEKITELIEKGLLYGRKNS